MAQQQEGRFSLFFAERLLQDLRRVDVRVSRKSRLRELFMTIRQFSAAVQGWKSNTNGIWTVGHIVIDLCVMQSDMQTFVRHIGEEERAITTFIFVGNAERLNDHDFTPCLTVEVPHEEMAADVFSLICFCAAVTEAKSIEDPSEFILLLASPAFKSLGARDTDYEFTVTPRLPSTLLASVQGKRKYKLPPRSVREFKNLAVSVFNFLCRPYVPSHVLYQQMAQHMDQHMDQQSWEGGQWQQDQQEAYEEWRRGKARERAQQIAHDLRNRSEDAAASVGHTQASTMRNLRGKLEAQGFIPHANERFEELVEQGAWPNARPRHTRDASRRARDASLRAAASSTASALLPYAHAPRYVEDSEVEDSEDVAADDDPSGSFSDSLRHRLLNTLLSPTKDGDSSVSSSKSKGH